MKFSGESSVLRIVVNSESNGRNDNSCNSSSGKGKLTPVWVQDN